ncbi:MAG: hypothetical protein JEZ07_19360 [Phycisphaerae bacterium]|nr:hypothetical protein [Phycisphaerae bacterium]
MQLLKNEKHLYCKNGILYAIVRLGDLNAEQQLYKSLSINAKADVLNRGLHFEYCKDALLGKLGSPPKDDGKHDCERCLIVLIEHIEDYSQRFICSRRIDLFTIRSFINNRKCLGPFTKSRLNKICSALNNSKLYEISKESK